MLPTSAELRERSKRYREAARAAADVAVKRTLAAHGLTLAQLAEAIEREGVAMQGDRAERYMRLFAKVSGGKMPEAVQTAPGGQRVAPDACSRIKAWRRRAEELRTTADQFQVPSAQESLREAAANYDKLADEAEAALTGRRR